MPDLTLKETAQILNVKYRHVHKMANDGKIPAYKIGRIWRVNSEELEKFRQGKYTLQRDETSQSAKTREEKQWHFAREVISGGLESLSTEEEYKNLLGLPIEKRH